MLSSDDFPSYAYNENDSLIFRLEVPCTDTKIILSEIPDSTKKQVIYGYVEFKSSDYFSSSGSADGQEILPRQKLRNNMKLYFKSGKLELSYCRGAVHIDGGKVGGRLDGWVEESFGI